MLVDVNMLKTSWIFRDRDEGELKSFDNFITTLANSESEQMYKTEFMSLIVDEFWVLY